MTSTPSTRSKTNSSARAGTSTSGNVNLDNGSLSASGTAAIALPQNVREQASNALLVSGKRASTHHPSWSLAPRSTTTTPG